MSYTSHKTRAWPLTRLHSRERGFTLTEMLVALTAGLVITVAVVGVSRQASHIFHEEMRTASVQSGARFAIERLSLDLARAGFMSTGNIVADPLVAKQIGAANTAAIPATYVGLRRLSAMRLILGGSKTATDPQSGLNALNPDALELGGNFTTTEAFSVREVAAPSGGCQRLWLQADQAPIWRLLGPGAAAAHAALRNAFKPSTPSGTEMFMVRIQDSSGRYQFAPTCENATPAGFENGNPFVDVALNSLGVGVMTAQLTGTAGGASGYGSGIMVNPVQIARWEMVSTVGANVQAGLDPKLESARFYLTRTFVDAKGVVIESTREVIGEYVVDLKFAFVVETGDSTNTAHTIFAFEDSSNALWSYDVSSQAPSSQGPQRIRSVRVRLAMRTPLPDRMADISPNPANLSGQRFMHRYCVGATAAVCTNGSENFARVRTLTTELSLPNQQRWFY